MQLEFNLPTDGIFIEPPLLMQIIRIHVCQPRTGSGLLTPPSTVEVPFGYWLSLYVYIEIYI